jgi:hypothetical protein
VLTLLVAATLIVSGAVTGINIEMNENLETNQPQTGDAGDEPVGIEQTYSKEFEIFDENGVETKLRHQGQIVWDNGMDYVGLYRGEVGGGFTSIIADDFKFTHTQVVMDVHFIAGYWGGTTETPWCIRFYNDAGGEPGSEIDTFCFDWDDIPKTPESSYWLMNVDIPKTTFNAGVTYWIAIFAEGSADPPYAGPAMHWSVLPGTHEAMWHYPSGGYGDGWVTTGTVTGYPPADMAFQLTSKPDHDVGVTEIIHPTFADSPGCPEIPVEVKVKNMGAEDETGIPVTVEIHENFWTQTFGGDAPDEMPFVITGDPCTWQYVPVETCYPNAITPYHGANFAELNQCGCLGTSYLTTEYPTDFTGQCIDPFLKFYMWHDTYSSDDNVVVEASVDGMNWQVIGGPYYRLCCPDCPVGWMEHRIDLASFVGETTVWFRFVGNCDMPTECYNQGIDYVCVFNMEYQETQEVDLDAGEEITLEFPDWIIECWWCQYANDDILFHIGAWTDMEGDENQGNDGFGPMQADFLPLWIHIPYEHDVGDKEITEPSEDYYWAQPIEMCQTIKNYGKNPESCFNVYMEVRDLTIETAFEEEFNSWEDNPEGAGSYSDDRPVGWRDINSGYGSYYDYGWEDSFTNNAGGTSPEARLLWYYANSYYDNILESPAINTAGTGKIELEFKSFIDDYGGGCYFYVEARADGSDSWTDYTPWPNPVSGNVGPDTYLVDISDEIGSGTQVRFRFYGYYFDFDYWYVDDVIFTTYLCGDEIYYQDKVCVDDLQVCEEKLVCFEDWIPEPPEECYCGTMDFCIISYTKMLDPQDENDANDMKQKFVTIEWLHDVALKEFTSPAKELGRAQIWDNGDTDGSNGLSVLGSPKRSIMDDFVVTENVDVNELHLIGLWNTWSPGSGTECIVQFRDDSSGSPGSVIATPSMTSFSDTATGRTWFSRPETQVVTTFDDVSLSPGTYWVEAWLGASAENFFWMAMETIQGSACWVDYSDYGGLQPGSNIFGSDYDMSFQLYGDTGGGGGEEYPDPEIYLPCGQEQEFCVMIENLGTYDEDASVIWTFYEYTPAKEVVDSGVVDISIDSLTEEEVCLFTYAFDEEGIYEVEVEVTIPKDCNPDNNGPESIIIGIDCCGPESCFTLSPEAPNGNNNWFTTAVTVTAYAWEEDCLVDSGIAKIVYIIDGVEDYIPGDHGTFVIDGDGVHFIEVYAVDNVGNEEDEHHTFEVAIDSTDPDVELIFDYYDDAGTKMVDFTAIAGDATSGIEKVEFYIDSSLEFTDDSFPYEWTIEWDMSYHEDKVDFKAKAFDGAGNTDQAIVKGDEISFFNYQSQQQTQQQQSAQQLFKTLAQAGNR